MPVSLTPLGSRLLIRIRPLPERPGGIIIAPDAWSAHITTEDGEKMPVSGGRREYAREADVLAIGDEVRDIEVGDVVLVPAACGQQVGDDRIVQESSVLGTV